jgi:hypothetical protein
MADRKKSDTDDGTDALRITAQFRTREGMAYELRDHGARLTVLITESGKDDTGGPWRVEVFSSLAPASAISRTAPTRREALRRTGTDWALDAQSRGLPMFDWDAVARALTVVRAI